jgi:bifunctional non-homologous end joining protein LigD
MRARLKELCWLKPKRVAQISFTEWTNCGLLRHATFEGLRDDKEPHNVREVTVGYATRSAGRERFAAPGN